MQAVLLIIMGTIELLSLLFASGYLRKFTDDSNNNGSDDDYNID